MAGSSSESRTPLNALTVDLEEYFQVSAFADAVPQERWPELPSRIEHQTERVLARLDAGKARATFFVLGWLAQQHPLMIRRIAEAGHEIASHGWAHIRVRDQTPEAFAADARRSREVLEDICATPVRGYRAASFSIDRRTPWAFDRLAEAGYRYSSSVYPIRHDHYGWPEAPRLPFSPSPDGVPEIPIATLRIGHRNLPCGGGGWFRLLPYRVSRWSLKRFNASEQTPAVFYLHGWELDAGQPVPPRVRASARLRHRVNLGRMERKFERLLADFRWDRMDALFPEIAAKPEGRLARAS